MKVSYIYFLEIIIDNHVSQMTDNVHKTIISLTKNDKCKMLYSLAKFGNLEMVEYILSIIGKKWFGKVIMNGAANGGSLEILRWGFQKKITCDPNICVHAIQIDTILLLIENGCKISESVVDEAVRTKNLIMINWLDDNKHLITSHYCDLR